MRRSFATCSHKNHGDTNATPRVPFFFGWVGARVDGGSPGGLQQPGGSGPAAGPGGAAVPRRGVFGARRGAGGPQHLAGRGRGPYPGGGLGGLQGVAGVAGAPKKHGFCVLLVGLFGATCFSPTCRRRRLCRFRTFASGRCFGVLIGTATASFRIRITFGRTPLGVYKQSGEDSKVRRKEDPMAHVYSESVHSQPDATTCLSLNRAYFSRVALFGCLSAFHKLPLLGGQNHSVSFLA